MARKKKFDAQAGFLWTQEGLSRVQGIADSRDLTPSDIFREAMNVYFAIQEGKATITYNAPKTVTSTSNNGSDAEEKQAASPQAATA